MFILLSLFPPFYNAHGFGFGNINIDSEPSLFITYQDLFSITELRSVRISYNRPNSGLWISYFGPELYREIVLRARYKVNIDNTWLTAEPSLLYLSQQKEISIGGSINLRAGFNWTDYTISINVINPVSYISSKTLPVEMELCFLFDNEWNKIGFKVNFLEDWGIGLGFGYFLKFQGFSAGLGLITNPIIPTAGFSIDLGNIVFNAGFQNHPALGLSKTFTVHYRR